MNQIDELPPSALERSLPDRLRRSAAAATPDPDALVAVRARATARRRRSRTGVLLGSAAAVAVIAVGVAVVTGDDPSTGVTAGPAEGSTATTAAPVPSGPADATLVIYRYPNATAEMIAEDPKMGGEWAMLFTGDSVHFANGPLDELGALSPSEPFDSEAVLAAIDANRFAPPRELAAALAATGYGFRTQIPTGPVAFGDDAQVRGMMELIATGILGPERAAAVAKSLGEMPGVIGGPGDAGVADGGATVTLSSQEADSFVVYRPSDGMPLRKGSLAVDTAQMEYVSIQQVHAADYLIAGRGTPNAVSTTTTTVVGIDEYGERTTTTIGIDAGGRAETTTSIAGGAVDLGAVDRGEG